MLITRLKSLVSRLEKQLSTRRAYKFFLKDWSRLTDLEAAAELLATMRFTRTLEPLVVERPQGTRLLVIAPHPDDEMIGPGGTLIRALVAGASVKTVYLTSGRPGDGADTEAEQVARECGYLTEFLRFPLHGIPVDEQASEKLQNAIFEFEPDTIFLPFILDDNDDHRRANELMLRLYDRLPEGSARRRINRTEFWGYQVYTTLPANVVVDITDFAERKADMIRLWKSQARSRDWAHFALGTNAFNSRLFPSAGRTVWVEGFFVAPAVAYLDWARQYFKAPHDAYYLNQYRS